MKLRVTLAAAVAAALALMVSGAGLSAGGFSPRAGGVAGIVPPIGAQSPSRSDAPQGSGNLTYHGGPIMRTNTTYAIFWLPPGYSYNSANSTYENTITQFFTDVAADSGKHGNVYTATPQYYDTVGGGTHHAAYSSSYGGSVVVTDALPTSGCSDDYTNVCLTDSQLKAEIKKTVEAQGWTEDTSHMYFLFTPPGVGSCWDDNSGCAYGDYCAYHGEFSGAHGTVVYANQPWTKVASCDVGQYPNGSDADPTINVVSHEHIEAITDPTLTAWWDAFGYEIGDKCAWGFGPVSGDDGSEYNQTINGHNYFLQEEYDNATSSCIQGVAPTITQFVPASGQPGAAVTITGTNFTGATGVYFNGTAATTFSVDSDTQITANVPDAATDGKVAVKTGGGIALSSGSFTVVTAAFPVIDGFSQSVAPVGAAIDINGSNFTGATGVTFGALPADFLVDSDSKITAVVPAGAVSGTVTVTTPVGAAQSPSPFTVEAISSFAPTKGKPGTVVTITGTALTGATGVAFGATDAASFTVVSDTKITATVAAGTGAGPVHVTTPNGTADSAAAFYAPPTVTSFSPTRRPFGGSVEIGGTGLTGATSVKFNGKPVLAISFDSDTQLTVTVPAGTASGKVTVTTPGGTATGAQPFTVIAIGALAPSKGKAGTLVTITGSGFTGATAVRFNGTDAASYLVVSDKKITATVAGGTTNGTVAVDTGDGTATSAKSFLIVPVISSISTPNAPIGANVVLTGAGLTGVTVVKFGSKLAAPTIDNDGQITVTVPAGTVKGKIAVSAPGGTASSPTVFTPLVVKSFTPAAGAAGATVTIVGTGFTGVTAVAFSGVPAGSFAFVSDTKLTATVPACSAPGPISVTTGGGTATSLASFTDTSTC